MSYGIVTDSYRFPDIAKRRIGQIQCATPCDPKPSFARSGLQVNEHGGYSFLDVDSRFCKIDGLDLPIADCNAMCEYQTLLGKLSIELESKDDSVRARVCRRIEARRGPPSVGSCACPEDDIVWRTTASEAAVVLHYKGTYELDCGFPEANYLPTHPL